ncbi:MAG: ribosome silencing factor [Alphaproteobacteria bacterium]|nr:ribosome silencing factor [Alphaproteobacteria bacterium]
MIGEKVIINHDKSRCLVPTEMKDLIETSLNTDKASDIVCIDLTGQSVVSDYMIIASGTSSRHVNALAEKLKDRLHARGVKNIRIEGQGQSDWVVVDAGDIVVHLFRPEVREFYNLEKMWQPKHGFEVTDGQLHA